MTYDAMVDENTEYHYPLQYDSMSSIWHDVVQFISMYLEVGLTERDGQGRHGDRGQTAKPYTVVTAFVNTSHTFTRCMRRYNELVLSQYKRKHGSYRIICEYKIWLIDEYMNTFSMPPSKARK